MSHGVDEEGVLRFFGEADAVVADTQPQVTGVTLDLLDVAFAPLGEAMESGEDAHGGVAIDAAEIGARRNGKDDLLHIAFRQRLTSSLESPNSATMSSWGIPSPGCCAIQDFEVATA